MHPLKTEFCAGSLAKRHIERAWHSPHLPHLMPIEPFGVPCTSGIPWALPDGFSCRYPKTSHSVCSFGCDWRPGIRNSLPRLTGRSRNFSLCQKPDRVRKLETQMEEDASAGASVSANKQHLGKQSKEKTTLELGQRAHRCLNSP